MNRDSFVFYRSFYEAIADLDDSTILETLKAIIEYALNGTPYTGTNKLVVSIFKLVKPNLDANNKKYIDGCKGGRPKKNKKPEVFDDETSGYSNAKPNEDDNCYEDDNNNDNVNDSTHPSLSDIEAYINEHNYKEFNCNKFFYHYQSKNWLINGQPITNWQALIEKWISQDATNKKKSSNGKSSSFQGRDYDFEQLENELLSN